MAFELKGATTSEEARLLAEEFEQLASRLAAKPEAATRAWQQSPPGFRIQLMPAPPDPLRFVKKLQALADTCRDVAVNGGILQGLSD